MPHHLRRFFAAPQNITSKAITITNPDAHHIKNVLRLPQGAEIAVATGNDTLYKCAITEIYNDHIVATIIEQLPTAQNPAPRITLAQAIPKAAKMDDVIRMACEIGVTNIIPTITERCVSQINEKNRATKLQRWRAIAHAAAKQSKAPFPAVVCEPTDINNLPAADLKLVLWEEESRPLKMILENHPSPESILILIGPEGGLTKNEIDTLRRQDFQSASLGNKILRTETAGVVAIGAIQFYYS